ncbi:carbohydrate sulfotransferase 3-like [Acanthaster planci]|uniref:Carbohydrate sulfotransferase 3-like n=1 Tax=Acanthaster planci TaxID=133434 RepID=A0A8B7YDX2_ACAPL|nr:carbohydrate sulfotransferase 3-like [Acanthaster planci]XP_022090585.1 carbohydrate sulfotransferase 3-like [Acanthaster planci]
MSKRYLFYLIVPILSAAGILLYFVAGEMLPHAPFVWSYRGPSPSDNKLNSGILRHYTKSSDVEQPSCNCSCVATDSITRAYSIGHRATTPSKTPLLDSSKRQNPVGHDVDIGTRLFDANSLGNNIVIQAAMRTGSSLVGEVFGQNDNIFYLFEPGISLENEFALNGTVFVQQLYVDMLSSLYHCDITSQDFYLKWLSRKTQNHVRKVAPRLFDSLCPQMKPGGSGHSVCGAVLPRQFMQECRAKRTIAIKSVRIWHIGMFLPLIQDINVKLKVIHLVRDPRGMTASRVPAMNVVKGTHHRLASNSFTEEMREYLRRFCSLSLENKETGWYHPKYRDNYLLLRYEDMALNPERVTQLIYNFTGLGAVPECVSKWIAENTQTYKPGLYSTTRVSSKRYQAWRTTLDFKTAKAIENVGRCAEMMQHFGYLPLQNESHLRKLSSSLVVPIPPPSGSQKYKSFRFAV